jgi:hypothetical protein
MEITVSILDVGARRERGGQRHVPAAFNAIIPSLVKVLA